MSKRAKKKLVYKLENATSVPIDMVKPYPYNVKIHTEPQIQKVATSIAKYGWDQPIVVDEDYVIIKGHARWFAAQKLGLKEVPVVINDKLTEDQVRAARIADNKVAEADYDLNILQSEIESLEDVFSFKDLGFDAKQMRTLFPGLEMEGVTAEPREERRVQEADEEGEYDASLPIEEGFIAPFEGDEAWLRKLSMVDYLNYHDLILVGFSSGKDSLTSLLYVLDNCDKSKVVAYYSNPGWGVDWPHSIAYVDYVEKKLGIKIWRSGFNNPDMPGGFTDLVVQRGYVGLGPCYVQNNLKVPHINGLLEQQGWQSRQGKNIVQIISIRWEESPMRAKIYPDRGYMKDTGNHYASPVLKWTTADVAKYIEEHGLKLHTAYEGEPRMGCLVCPKGHAEGCLIVRKKFPLLYRQIVKWYALGVRRKGQLQFESFLKWLANTDDPRVDREKLTGELAALAMSSEEMDDFLVAEGIAPQKPYITLPYDPRIHKYPTDEKEAPGKVRRRE